MAMMAPSLRKVAIAALLCLYHHASVADASFSSHHHDHHNHNADVQEFTPPKLSFTAADYFASIQHDNVVNSVQQHSEDEVDEGLMAVPWTIFQGVSFSSTITTTGGSSSSTSSNEKELEELAQREKAAIQRRSGPLLTLFPDNAAGSSSSSIAASAAANNKHAKHAVLTPAEQRSYLATHGKDCHPSSSSDNDDGTLDRYDLFLNSPTLSNLATELWKYCTLYVEGGIYVDAETAPLVALGDVLHWDHPTSSSSSKKNYAVVASTHDAGVSPLLLPGSSSSISDAVTTASSLGTGNPIAISSVLAIATKEHSVPYQMVDTLMETPVEILEEDALLLPKRLMELIREDEEKEVGEWGFLRQRCNGIEVAGGEGGLNNDEGHHRTLRHCPISSGYCCEILDPEQNFVFLLSRQSLVPNQILPHSSTLPQPYNHESSYATTTSSMTRAQEEALPFLATIYEETTSLSPEPFTPGSSETTPNLFELLSSENALPNQEGNKQACMDCLREKKGADCTICKDKCPNFCGKVCTLDVKEKPVKRVLSVVGPRYRKDPERLIPRIVHQTWFETVTPEKYPNMSRLIESWKRSGWEYHFWDDASAAQFLSTHFPPEVREAYDSILPGAFKADLFRYCVLLIQGGIYADMDVMLESHLDAAVPPDVGFMVPLDAPGTRPDHRMCLWNGFIASAPAHPYLARAIERVVNNIRNRFTVVDYDGMMCPDPELSVVHAFSTLFTAGPCILGLTVNEIMGREFQQTFEEGDLEMASGGGGEVSVPGRTIILQQNKWDMGAHRFTWVENNLVVAATDMPDYDDRKNLEGEDEEQATHYSKTLDRNNLYGEGKVYVNRDISHERIEMKTQQALTFSAM